MKRGDRILMVLVLGWIALLVLLPLSGIVREVWTNGLSSLVELLRQPTALRAFMLTFWLTLGSVVINTIFGTMLSFILVRHSFRGKVFLEGIIDLPFAISPVIAGFMFIILFGPRGWLGSWFDTQNIKIIYAFPGMLLATLFVTFPFVVREVVPVLREYGIDQEEAAMTLGASRWQTFWKVTLPSIKWGMIYGITLTIARAIGEFGAVIVVSGGIINKTQTATLLIHHRFMDFDFTGACAAAMVLAAVSFIILIAMQYIFSKRKV